MDEKQYIRYKQSRAQKILKIIFSAMNDGHEKVGIDYIKSELDDPDCDKRKIYYTLKDLNHFGHIKKTYLSKKKLPTKRKLYVTLTKSGLWYVRHKKNQAKEFKGREENGNI